MLDNILTYIVDLVRDKVEEMLGEVIDDVLGLIGADESIIQEYLDSLTPTKRMLASNILMFLESVLKMIADKLVDEEVPVS